MVASRVQSAALRAAGLRPRRLRRMRCRHPRYQRQQRRNSPMKSSTVIWPGVDRGIHVMSETHYAALGTA